MRSKYSLYDRHEPAASGAFDTQAYWETRHQTDYGSLKAVGHRGLSDADNVRQYEIKKRRIVEVIHRYVDDPAGKTLLDAGCGVGLLTAAYVDLGFDVVGVDFSETAIQGARSRGVNARLLVSSLSRLDLGEAFDVITVIDVLLHVVKQEDWHDTITAIARHLKPTGILVVLDHFAEPGESWSDHCHPRSLEAYTAALSALDMAIDSHDRFELAHEASMKDLIVAAHTPHGVPSAH